MSAEYFFLDANIISYSFDPTDKAKQQVATELIKSGFVEGDSKISFQIIHEFLNHATRKFSTKINQEDAEVYLHQVLMPMCSVYPSEQLWEHALSIHYRW